MSKFIQSWANVVERSSKRNEQKEQGLFDGRFRNRIVKDKKKELSRNWARRNQN